MMKRLAVIFIALVLIGCEEKISVRDLSSREGRIYKNHSKEPFTGTINKVDSYWGIEKGKVVDGYKEGKWEDWTAKGNLKVTYTCNKGKRTACKSHMSSFGQGYCKWDVNLSYARCDKVRSRPGD